MPDDATHVSFAGQSPPADEINRMWQHGMCEEKLFHDRLNYFAGMQVGLLGVFAILHNKEPAPWVFIPLTVAALALALLWLRVQVKHWRYCVHVHDRIRRDVPEYGRTVAAFAAPGRTNGLAIAQPLGVKLAALGVSSRLEHPQQPSRSLRPKVLRLGGPTRKLLDDPMHDDASSGTGPM